MSTLHVSVTQIREHVAIGRQENQHVLPLDRPEATGGTGLGFNGGHLMLLGWGGCFKSVLVASAQARDIDLHDIHLEIDGDIVDTPKRFARLRMTVSFDADVAPEEKRKLLRVAENGCAVSNTLKAAAEMDISLQE